MNQKTARLLKRHARIAGKKEADVKKWWNGLGWKQRELERRRLQRETGADDA